MPDSRYYPVSCQSMHCGRSDCTGCLNKPILDEFNAWKEKHQAVRPDPVWCPSYYEATI